MRLRRRRRRRRRMSLSIADKQPSSCTRRRPDRIDCRPWTRPWQHGWSRLVQGAPSPGRTSAAMISARRVSVGNDLIKNAEISFTSRSVTWARPTACITLTHGGRIDGNSSRTAVPRPRTVDRGRPCMLARRVQRQIDAAPNVANENCKMADIQTQPTSTASTGGEYLGETRPRTMLVGPATSTISTWQYDDLGAGFDV